jgi:hypothetical protein
MALALTALAIWILSCRIAIISCRLYFITGHCPVVKDSDFAHPVPRLIDRDPFFAASSTAPGSPVTYRPGMPSAPPAAVMSIRELSTVAGASWEASLPCPRASKPTASTPQSTSGTPRICSICSAGEPFETSTVSQPKLRAWASRCSFMSPTITTAAPSRCAEAAAARPTGPAPAM